MSIRNDGTTAAGVVGMVFINCFACGEPVETDVAVESIGTKGGSYLTVQFRLASPTHHCTGRRS